MKRRLPFFAPFAVAVLAVLTASNAGWPRSAAQVAASPQPALPAPSGGWYPTRWGKSFRPKSGYVPDQKTAIEVAKAVLLPIYGEQVKSEEPFRVSLSGNVWTVKGAVRPEPGGNAEIKLSKIDGTILYVSHTQ